ncbi:aldo/keto reductase [Lactobacillus sp.]|uniref:aldo/keto reductase n=1 Tax=Lactobacillus sp. TaxID=1591 RepID=UPI0019BC4471|nr:aldo/keto reductase [Lactobacillus sp.]MBD5430199.1 aldo/keto reductase [Lactobacillus sp.]
MTNEVFSLNNDVKIPAIGLGTFQMEPDDAEKATLEAIQDGYRLIDTANGYMNEKAVGRAIAKSGINREELFISSKLWPTVYEKETAVDDTLRRLSLDYLDLLFLHQPSGDWKVGYRQLEKAYKEGKIKAIGISNFEGKELDELLTFAEIKPQVIQFEAHPYFTAQKVMATLKPYDTRLMAWYPLGHGDSSLMQQPIFTKLGEKYGKSNVQIILRWHVQAGHIVIPGSTNPAHIKLNLDIFDFELTDEEMAEIAKLDTEKRYYNPNPEMVAGYAKMDMDFDSQK